MFERTGIAIAACTFGKEYAGDVASISTLSPSGAGSLTPGPSLFGVTVLAALAFSALSLLKIKANLLFVWSGAPRLLILTFPFPTRIIAFRRGLSLWFLFGSRRAINDGTAKCL